MMDPSNMVEVTEQEFQDRFEEYMERIESHGEHFLIRREDGTAVVAAPITEELEPLLDIMPDFPYDDQVPGEPSF
jgi:hypothetical protein|tara:strand:+ start:156 stop:380 length:225 start_codon:yes stop_codon:yes gene_type:complete